MKYFFVFSANPAVLALKCLCCKSEIIIRFLIPHNYLFVQNKLTHNLTYVEYCVLSDPTPLPDISSGTLDPQSFHGIILLSLRVQGSGFRVQGTGVHY